MTKAKALKAHVALNVRKLQASIEFYRKLFGIEPCKAYKGYAKFDVHDPPLNLTLNEREFNASGALFHMGIQVDSTAAVLEFRKRWYDAGLKTRDEMQVICGHALQDKTWVSDPDGTNWEVFVVHKDNLPMFRGNACVEDRSCQESNQVSQQCKDNSMDAVSAGTNFSLRNLIEKDWKQVRSIYAEGISSGNATFQQDLPSWEDWNRSHLANCRIVAEHAGSILGWAALTPVSDRCVYSGVAEVSIYVKTDSRKQGVGRELLQALINESESSGVWTLQAGIFPENIGSVALHKRCGFREVGRRERIGKLRGVWRDTLLLERRSQVVGKEDKLQVNSCAG